MNPSTAFGTVFVDELIRCGLREAVLAPGSRSAPLAMALFDRAAAGGPAGPRLHVRIDERSAAFLGLGLAKASRRPVALICTSGTAAAHFHAAVIEADEAGVPLIVLTADRPPELRGTGTSQTIDQLKLYGGAVRWFSEAGVPEERPGMVRYWRSLACRAWAMASGGAGGLPGPVHVNLPLRDPLVPDADGSWPEPLDGRPNGAPWTAAGSSMYQRAASMQPIGTSMRPGDGGGLATSTRPGDGGGPGASPPPRGGGSRRRRRRAPGAGRTPCPPTATCSTRRNSSPGTGPISSSRPGGPACPAASLGSCAERRGRSRPGTWASPRGRGGGPIRPGPPPRSRPASSCADPGRAGPRPGWRPGSGPTPRRGGPRTRYSTPMSYRPSPGWPAILPRRCRPAGCSGPGPAYPCVTWTSRCRRAPGCGCS